MNTCKFHFGQKAHFLTAKGPRSISAPIHDLLSVQDAQHMIAWLLADAPLRARAKGWEPR